MNYGRKVNFCCLIGMPYNVQININKSDYRCADAWLPMIVCECVCVVSCPLECTLQDLIDSNSIRLCSCCFKQNNKTELKTMRAIALVTVALMAPLTYKSCPKKENPKENEREPSQKWMNEWMKWSQSIQIPDYCYCLSLWHLINQRPFTATKRARFLACLKASNIKNVTKYLPKQTATATHEKKWMAISTQCASNGKKGKRKSQRLKSNLCCRHKNIEEATTSTTEYSAWMSSSWLLVVGDFNLNWIKSIRSSHGCFWFMFTFWSFEWECVSSVPKKVGLASHRQQQQQHQ